MTDYSDQMIFAQVSHALAAMHGIAVDRVPALEARLKHYQKMGFPEGINTGRGRAAKYNIGHAVQFAMALEANQMGLTPARARLLVCENMDRLKNAVSLALYDEDNPLTMFITFDPAVLSDLSNEECDRADATFVYAGRGQFLENFEDWTQRGFSRLAVVNLSVMLSNLFKALQHYSATPIEHWRRHAADWSRRHDGDDN